MTIELSIDELALISRALTAAYLTSANYFKDNPEPSHIDAQAVAALLAKLDLYAYREARR